MIRKHKIQKVYIWSGESGRSGFWMVTKSGVASVPIIPDNLPRTKAILKYYLPHLFNHLVSQGSWSEEELNALLIGKYLYGCIVKREYRGMIEERIV